MMNIREMQVGEERLLWELHRSTIRSINLQDYSPAQVNAWASDEIDADMWSAKMQAIRPFVVDVQDQIVGYSDLQANGLVGHFFVHHEWQRQGVGSVLMREIQSRATAANIARLESYVSITARPFFQRFDFSVVEKKEVLLRGETLTNYVMRRTMLFV